jgi:murein DD-endopeptidase MepM/ murein hydrolase activator NlpD
MLRAILGIGLLLFVAGLGFFLGRSSVPVGIAKAPAPEAPTSTAQPTAEQSRARAETAPVLPQSPPPPVEAEQDLKSPTLPHTVEGQAPGDSAPLFAKGLGLPIANLKAADVQDSFAQSRGGGERRHEATDIMAPRGTPVVAVDTGIVTKFFTSKAGGLTIYQFDPSQKYAYYYAHLDRYAEGLREGMLVKKGDLIGYVGSTGNANPAAPHLHFAIFELGPEKLWWEGKPINPYPILMRAVGK